MSYLALYTRRSRLGRPDATGARVDEKTLLNRRKFDGGAHVRAFVEDTSGHRVRRHRLPSPRLKLRIADCENAIHLEFSVDSPRRPQELAAQDRHPDRRARAVPLGRCRRRRRCASSASTADNHERRRDVVPEATRHASRATVGAGPGLGAGAELGRRLRLGGRQLDAAPALSRPRLGGRQLLRVGVEADSEEREGGRALPRRGRASAPSPRSCV